VENRFCLDVEVDSRSPRGREYLVFLMAFPALLLRSTRKTSTTIAITMTTATMAAMTPPAMAPALELLPVALSVVLPTHVLSSPSSLKLEGQLHVKLPSMFVHVCEQPPFSTAHSLRSMQFLKSAVTT
jgi:hypothetical protein